MKEYVPADYTPVIIQFILAAAFVVFALVTTHLLGPKQRGKMHGESFEAGLASVGDARAPLSIKYFLIAILFVLFDVEIIFMYPWAVNFKALGLVGFIEMLTFMFFFLAGFYYIIKKGVFKWE
jgi:NADH-quinone oxidoreductase subunit A